MTHTSAEETQSGEEVGDLEELWSQVDQDGMSGGREQSGRPAWISPTTATGCDSSRMESFGIARNQTTLSASLYLVAVTQHLAIVLWASAAFKAFAGSFS